MIREVTYTYVEHRPVEKEILVSSLYSMHCVVQSSGNLNGRFLDCAVQSQWYPACSYQACQTVHGTLFVTVDSHTFNTD